MTSGTHMSSPPLLVAIELGHGNCHRSVGEVRWQGSCLSLQRGEGPAGRGHARAMARLASRGRGGGAACS
jgi:hypothetical protein